MKRADIATRMARRAGSSRGEAADRLDHAVSEILKRLKRGESAVLPGLGSFKAGPGGEITFESQKRKCR